ncbi:DUF3054 domain-containing protein [Mobilicoccus sp.]|uniref:DUF3054 domain-containing protein n=1 Tax=Mobilicoccus sp. TaxID=2034349 RepID=UPI0028A04340|nr:DUF3054 domain-containing protein [Mobilicoccus sp.]
MTTSTSTSSTPTHPVPTVSPAVAFLLDLVLVVVFAALGRAAHGEAWTGAPQTAWPFLIGCALGWAVWWAARRVAPISLSGGVVVWLVTVAGGMSVRALVGQGTHWSFVIVSLVTTAVLLLGWRAIAARRTRRSAPGR